MTQHHLAEEDTDFLEMTATSEHPAELIADEEINEYANPLVYLIAREEADARADAMTLRNEPKSLGKLRRSKV